MNKKTKLAILISAAAAVVSAVVLVIVFWDKLMALCPCGKEEVCYNEEELSDFADLEE